MAGIACAISWPITAPSAPKLVALKPGARRYGGRTISGDTQTRFARLKYSPGLNVGVSGSSAHGRPISASVRRASRSRVRR